MLKWIVLGVELLFLIQMEQMSFSDYMTILHRDKKLNELLNESDS
jgi:hypothetical protein